MEREGDPRESRAPSRFLNPSFNGLGSAGGLTRFPDRQDEPKLILAETAGCHLSTPIASPMEYARRLKTKCRRHANRRDCSIVARIADGGKAPEEF